LIKNSQPFGKKFQKTAGGIFLTRTVHTYIIHSLHNALIRRIKAKSHYTRRSHMVHMVY